MNFISYSASSGWKIRKVSGWVIGEDWSGAWYKDKQKAISFNNYIKEKTNGKIQDERRVLPYQADLFKD